MCDVNRVSMMPKRTAYIFVQKPSNWRVARTVAGSNCLRGKCCAGTGDLVVSVEEKGEAQGDAASNGAPAAAESEKQPAAA